jgi:hypothetical protein
MKAYAIQWGRETISPVQILDSDDGRRFREPTDISYDQIIPVDATVVEIDVPLRAVSADEAAEVVFGHGEYPRTCPRCGQRTSPGGQATGGKVTVWCSFCGRYTVGHDARREKGPARKFAGCGAPTKRHELGHIYGGSYFGSGGGYGRVCCLENCRTVGTADNGFMSGPEAVEVIDWRKPAEFEASGGDAIGERGRSWGESGRWNPATRRWE